MKLRHIHRNVSDIDVVTDWYQKHLGFTTMHEVPGHLYILEHSDSECLIGFERGAPLEPASSVHLILRVGDVDALHGELSENGVEIDFPPTNHNPTVTGLWESSTLKGTRLSYTHRLMVSDPGIDHIH